MLKPAPHGGLVRVETYRDFPQRRIAHFHWQHRVPPRDGPWPSSLPGSNRTSCSLAASSGCSSLPGSASSTLERFVRLPEKNHLLASSTSYGVRTSVTVQRALFNGMSGCPRRR